MKRFSRCAVLFFAMVLASGLVFASGYEASKKAGDLTVDVKMDRNPPVTGKNNVEVAVKDAAGKPVTDAKVLVEYSMPAMPGMPAMSYKAEAKPSGEAYRTEISPSMAGPWNVAVRVARGAKTETARFTVDVK